MEINRQYCPICLGIFVEAARVQPSADGYGVDCPACGNFAITEEAWEDQLDPQIGAGSRLTPVQRARLSHRIRRARSKEGNRRYRIDGAFVGRFVNDGCPGPTPANQASNIIQFIGDHIYQSGNKLKNLPDDFYSIIGAANPNSAVELLIELIRQGLLVGVDASSMGRKEVIEIGLTLGGWQAYEAEKTGKFSGKVGFIAMKFGDTVLDQLVAEIVKPAVKKEIGYDVVDMRDVARAGIIDNIMRAQIRDSAFVLVDLTHDNSGAYWEAGYAEGLGKPIIYLCEKSKIDQAKTHFDTNHCTTITWSSDDRDGFSKELIATLRRSLSLFETTK
jgi:hypothetical protein